MSQGCSAAFVWVDFEGTGGPDIILGAHTRLFVLTMGVEWTGKRLSKIESIQVQNREGTCTTEKCNDSGEEERKLIILKSTGEPGWDQGLREFSKFIHCENCPRQGLLSSLGSSLLVFNSRGGSVPVAVLVPVIASLPKLRTYSVIGTELLE